MHTLICWNCLTIIPWSHLITSNVKQYYMLNNFPPLRSFPEPLGFGHFLLCVLTATGSYFLHGTYSPCCRRVTHWCGYWLPFTLHSLKSRTLALLFSVDLQLEWCLTLSKYLLNACCYLNKISYIQNFSFYHSCLDESDTSREEREPPKAIFI